jgi:hypothetical protein
MKKITILYAVLFLFTMLSACKKKKDEVNNSSTNNSSGGILVIENGSGRFQPGYSGNYSAYVVDLTGARIDVTGVTWSSSNQGAVTVSGSTISAVGTGITTLTASVNYNGTVLKASIPVAVSMPTIFDVVPSVVLWSADAGPITLDPVYIGTGNPGTYTYTTSDASVATVSSSGLLTLLKAGECTITVTAPGLDGQPSVLIPVLSIGAPSVTLPVSRIAVTPSKTELFIGDQLSFTAKAYNGNNAEVSTGFTWKLTNDTIASIDANGKLTALHPGTTKVLVTSNGIIAESEVFIYPKSVIEVTPMVASIAPAKTRQFTAQTYLVSKSGNGYNLTATANPADLKWEIPSFGIPVFDIATVNTTGLVTMKSNATVGMTSFLGAYSPSNPDMEAGVGILEVSNCDCGSGTGVTSIVPGQSTYTIHISGSPTAQITATTAPAGLSLHYCSQDPAVISVDPNGLVTAVGPGTGTVTICDGNVETTVTVNVSF